MPASRGPSKAHYAHSLPSQIQRCKDTYAASDATHHDPFDSTLSTATVNTYHFSHLNNQQPLYPAQDADNMPLSLPQRNIDRSDLSYQSKFSRRTIEDPGPLLSLGRLPPPKQPLPPTPPSPSRELENNSRTLRYIKRRTRQKARELIEIQKISLQSPPTQTGSLTRPAFQWIRGNMIGKGSQGKVYLALNVTSGGVMAVKQVERPSPSPDRQSSGRIAVSLREEQETIRHLNHPNIVEYLGFEENNQTLNIFLEYVSGGTIESCVKAFGRLQEDVTRYFTRQILEGLAYLHSKGILHRDLKAANILVMDSGVCKISDFGISKRKSRAFSFIGTSYCMAPETLCPGSRGYDAKVDVWSVGCVVHQMWTGARTWADVDCLTVWSKLGDNEQPPLPSDVTLSTFANHFRQECFQINPVKRPTAAFLLDHPYLELPSTWEFPGMRALGCAPSAAISAPRRATRSLTPKNPPPAFIPHVVPVYVAAYSSSTVLPPPLSPPPSSPLPQIPRPLPSPPSYTTNPRPLPSAPPSPAPTRLPRKTSSSSITSTSTDGSLGIYCDPPPRVQVPQIMTIPESDDASAIIVRKSTRKSKPTPFRFTPPPLPNPEYPYSKYLLPPAKHIDAKTRYPESLLRKTESNPELTLPPDEQLEASRPHRANSTSAAEAKSDVAIVVTKSISISRSKPLPIPPSSSPPVSPPSQSKSFTSPRPLPSPKPPSPPSVDDSDTIISSLSRSGSTWQRPPPAVTLRPRANTTAHTATKPLANTTVTRPLPSPTYSIGSRRSRASTRPDLKELIQKLDDYFPEHNLDAPVVVEKSEDPDSPLSETPFESLLSPEDREFFEDVGIYNIFAEYEQVDPALGRTASRSKRSRKTKMKSIKSIAEENVLDQLTYKSSSRRQTKCWDSRVEEIKVPW